MSKKTKQVTEFVWPEFSSDSKRIKAYTQRYKDLSIVEAFEDCYNMKLEVKDERVNMVPRELSVGDVITTNILSISKDRVIFDTANFKANLQSSVNLAKFEKFKHFLPMDPIDIQVTRVDKDKVMVDPISPMLDSWLSPILKDPTIQKVIPTADGNGPKPIMVKDLKLTRGGFMGKAVIPNVSEFVGEDYTVDAFVPGSQIVLNITDNFEQFNGKSIWTFVVNYMPKPGSKTDMSLVCSAKEYIKFVGEVNLIQLFNSWCEGSDLWKNSTATPIEGKVTGVINSSKKCGVFVELPSLSITGMVQAKPEELVNYKPHQEVMVKIAGFDEDTFYNPVVKQVQHADPYVIEDGRLKKCNLKPILKFA